MRPTRFCSFGGRVSWVYPTPIDALPLLDTLLPLIPYPPDTYPQKEHGTRDSLSPQKGHGTEKGLGTRDTLLPPMNKLTDACENITFQHLLLRGIITSY